MLEPLRRKEGFYLYCLACALLQKIVYLVCRLFVLLFKTMGIYIHCRGAFRMTEYLANINQVDVKVV